MRPQIVSSRCKITFDVITVDIIISFGYSRHLEGMNFDYEIVICVITPYKANIIRYNNDKLPFLYFASLSLSLPLCRSRSVFSPFPRSLTLYNKIL